MRKSLFKENVDFVKTRFESPRTSEEAREKINRLSDEKHAKLHRISNYAMSVGAGLAVESGVMATTFRVGNTISEGLTGESLHGVGLAATSVAAVTLGFGAGYRTATAVEDGLKMVDEYRARQAFAELHALEALESADMGEQE